MLTTCVADWGADGFSHWRLHARELRTLARHWFCFCPAVAGIVIGCVQRRREGGSTGRLEGAGRAVVRSAAPGASRPR